MDPGKSRSSKRSFVGLEVPPVVTADVPGREFALSAEDLGSVDIGSPIYYRRVRVGQVVSAELDPDGHGVRFRIFVNAPYDRYVTTGSRFWNASGIDFSADSSGFHLQTQSLASVAIGGVAFQTPPEAEPGQPAPRGAQFQLFRDRETAFKQPATVKDRFVLHFRQSVRGLNVGSPVDFRGVPIGEVTRISLDFDRKQLDLRPAVEIEIYPERIAARFRTPGPPLDPVTRASTLQRFIDRGMRAQLRTGNLITGQLYITLDFFPKAAPVPRAAANSKESTVLEIPTVPGGFEEIQASITSLLQKLEKLPLDTLAEDVHGTLGSLQKTLQDLSRMTASVENDLAPDLRSTLEQARATLDKAQGLLSQDAPLQGDLRGTLREVSRAAQSLRSLADYLERHPESVLRGRREERQ
jgi:paraquat-inducible protein B